MLDNYDIVQALTRQSPSPNDRQRWTADFSYELGWRPSDRLILQDAESFSTAHLIVEHGLQNTAVISFLRSRFPDLTPSEQKVLLNASYNNLIDWHINIDYEAVTYVYNRYRPPSFFVKRNDFSRGTISRLSSSAFEQLAADHPAPDVPDLDDALIRTVSAWKRYISVELPGVSNLQLSALFNAIIFVRATEDHAQRKALSTLNNQRKKGLLSEIVLRLPAETPIRQILATALQELGIATLPNWLLSEQDLTVFDALMAESTRDLFLDFYRNKYERYFEYDFSLMSKHALSRIYEHYVSELRQPMTDQATLFPRLPEERIERSFGNVYTPEFVARFFARFLRKQLPLGFFQRMVVRDPACGSGIFLRTILESQQETLFSGSTSQALAGLFERVHGVDIDANACQAARLSLALLALVLVDKLPDNLDIVHREVLEYYLNNPNLRSSADVVVANPPFVRLEGLSQDQRLLVSQVLGELARGRVDLYLAVLRVAVEMLKPGGYGLFVLPKNFLVSDNAAGVRAFMSSEAWVHCVVDLSLIDVFKDVSAYVILMVFQRKLAGQAAPRPIFAQCPDLVGHALQDVLDGRVSDSTFYSVFDLDEDALQGEKWSIVPPVTANILKKFAHLSTLGAVAALHQGIVTGADDVFILDASEIPAGEEDAYIPLLADRDMEPFTVPAKTRLSVFYPYAGNQLLDERALKSRFPGTFAYLRSHKAALQARTAVTIKGVPWWRPSWPRDPKNLLRPKILTPHIVLAPRFSLDSEGRLGVTRSPVVLAKPGQAAEKDHLLFLLAILNSSACFWHIALTSHQYRGGYSRLEVSTLKSIAVPDPSTIERARMRLILRLATQRLTASGSTALGLEEELDNEIADAYGLSPEERKVIGLRK
jgi:hypothetical protein